MSDTYNTDTAPGSPLLTLPLDAWHRARGARMVAFAGFAMPVQYDGIIAEHLWTRTSAGFFDVSHMGQLHVAGPGAEAALEALLPIDLATLPVGGVRYSLLLDEAGGILDDLMVTRRASGFYLVVNGATRHADIAWMQAHLPPGVVLTELADSALLALQGPLAVAALAALAPGVAALGFMQTGTFTLAGADAWISRTGYTGEDGFEIAVPADAAVRVADLLCARPQVKPAGLGARDSLRLEAGLPLYGHDLSPQRGPVEAGLAFAIARRRRAEGGFSGAARVLADLAGGATAPRRVGLLVEGRLAAREGAAVLVDGEAVGTVTSGGFSPSLDRPVAMAYLPAAHAGPGTAVQIAVRGRTLAATVTPLPFLPHRYVRKGAA